MGRTSKNEVRYLPRRRINKNFSGATGQQTSGYDVESGIKDFFQEYRDTRNTPGFRSARTRLFKDDLPMNYFLYIKTSTIPPYGTKSRHYSSTGDSEHWYQALEDEPYTTSSSILTSDVRNAVDNAALFASLSDLKGMKVNLGVAFGERNRTFKLLGDTTTKLANAITSLKKGSVPGALQALGYSGKRHAPKATKQLAADWLAIQYGWKPLLSDVYGAAEALAKHGTYAVRVSTSRSHRWAITNTAGPNEQWNNVRLKRTEFGVYTRKYVYIFSYSSEVIHDLSSVGITNPLAVAWELLPWSFVFDWAIKVGEWIDSLDATAGLQFLKGCKTRFERWEIHESANGAWYDSGVLYDCNAKASRKVVVCERNPLTSFQHPRVPRFGTLLTPLRAANAIALIRQRTIR